MKKRPYHFFRMPSSDILLEGIIYQIQTNSTHMLYFSLHNEAMLFFEVKPNFLFYYINFIKGKYYNPIYFQNANTIQHIAIYMNFKKRETKLLVNKRKRTNKNLKEKKSYNFIKTTENKIKKL